MFDFWFKKKEKKKASSFTTWMFPFSPPTTTRLDPGSAVRLPVRPVLNLVCRTLAVSCKSIVGGGRYTRVYQTAAVQHTGSGDPFDQRINKWQTTFFFFFCILVFFFSDLKSHYCTHNSTFKEFFSWCGRTRQEKEILKKKVKEVSQNTKLKRFFLKSGSHR